MTARAAITVYFALLALLGLTYGSYFLELGMWNVVINITIAAAKTLLVALFYMHLKQENVVVRLFSLVGVIWLSLLFVLTLADYLHRGSPSAAG